MLRLVCSPLGLLLFCQFCCLCTHDVLAVCLAASPRAIAIAAAEFDAVLLRLTLCQICFLLLLPPHLLLLLKPTEAY